MLTEALPQASAEVNIGQLNSEGMAVFFNLELATCREEILKVSPIGGATCIMFPPPPPSM